MLPKNEASHTMRMLPEDFQPSDKDVIFGRGRTVYLHPGNAAFRRLVDDCLRDYSDSSTKLEKSYILRNIVAQVRMNSPNGGFVKKDPRNGRWYEVGDFLAREKTSQTFRDALYEQYKSSNTAKKLRRLQDQDVHLPKRAFSVMGLGEFKGNASMNDIYTGQRPSMSSLMHEHAGSNLMHSCPNLGQNLLGQSLGNLDGSIASMRNFEWDQPASPKPRAVGGLTDSLLAMTNTRQSSARSVMDFAIQYQKATGGGNGSFSSLGPFTGNLGSYDEHATMSQHSHILLQSAPQAQVDANITLSSNVLGELLTKQSQQQSVPATDIFDRLVNMVGSFYAEGDPYEPQPVQQQNTTLLASDLTNNDSDRQRSSYNAYCSSPIQEASL